MITINYEYKCDNCGKVATIKTRPECGKPIYVDSFAHIPKNWSFARIKDDHLIRCDDCPQITFDFTNKS